jgi:hypothetical protein
VAHARGRRRRRAARRARERGHLAFPGGDDPLDAPLDLEPHRPVVAARTEQGLAELLTVVDWQGSA